MICYSKIRENPDLPIGESYEALQIDKGFIIDSINTISTLAKGRSLPLLIVNNTNKFIKINRHGLLANISRIPKNVTQVNSVIKNNINGSKLDLNDLDVPEKYRSKTEKLIIKNQDLFANKDSELGNQIQ